MTAEATALEGGAPPLAPVPESIRACCSTDEQRQRLATPFAVVVDGEQWAAATDGHCLAAIPWAGPLRTDGPDAAKLIPTALPTHKASAAVLREWAGPPPVATLDTCEACNGEGEAEADDCFCPHCEGMHDCEDCDGKGKRVPRVPIRYGAFLDGTLNQPLLARVLLSAPEGDLFLTHCAPKEAFVLRGPSWLAMIVPINPDRSDESEVLAACPGIEALTGAASAAPAAPSIPNFGSSGCAGGDCGKDGGGRNE